MATKLSKIVADFRTSLATKIAVGGTTATLQSATDDDGVSLPAGQYFFTLDGDNPQKEHIVCTLSGTSLSSIKSITRQGVQSSGSVREHRIGSSVTITNFAHIKYINDLLDGTTNLNASLPLEYDATASITTANQLATKDYVDSVAIAGGADASTTVKGISKLSTAPASATDPIAVGTNDTRIPTQDENNALVGTSGTPSTSNKYVTDDDTTATPTANAVVRGNGSGKIDSGWASNVANGLVSLNGSTQLPTSSAILLTDVLRQFVASDDLLISSNGETTETATSYALKKTIVVNFGGTYRVKFDLRGNTNGLGYGRVYRNGVALGTEQSQNGPTNSASDYVTKTEDLVFAAGDSIQIYQKAQSTATSYVRNFRVYGTTTTTLTYGYAF
jgi:hypothetical protein